MNSAGSSSLIPRLFSWTWIFILSHRGISFIVTYAIQFFFSCDAKMNEIERVSIRTIRVADFICLRVFFSSRCHWNSGVEPKPQTGYKKKDARKKCEVYILKCNCCTWKRNLSKPNNSARAPQFHSNKMILRKMKMILFVVGWNPFLLKS